MAFTVAVPAGFRLDRVARSHGWYDLPPFALGRHASWRGGARRRARARRRHRRADDALAVTTLGDARRRPSARCAATVTTMLRLDEDLAPLYALTDGDARLAYARAHGVGRLLRAPTAFEDVIKMLLTTNCSWSLTRVMVTRLVEALGAPAPSGARAFPTPAAMAKKNETFYRDVVRAGYRAPHLAKIARDVAAGRIDPEAWRTPTVDDEDAAQASCWRCPASGPTPPTTSCACSATTVTSGSTRGAAASSRSSTRASATSTPSRNGATSRFGRFAGLAMWLDLTRDWHEGDDQGLHLRNARSRRGTDFPSLRKSKTRSRLTAMGGRPQPHAEAEQVRRAPALVLAAPRDASLDLGEQARVDGGARDRDQIAHVDPVERGVGLRDRRGSRRSARAAARRRARCRAGARPASTSARSGDAATSIASSSGVGNTSAAARRRAAGAQARRADHPAQRQRLQPRGARIGVGHGTHDRGLVALLLLRLPHAEPEVERTGELSQVDHAR